MPKHSPLLKLDKDVAELLFGHSPGRPTISRRAGRHVARALGVHEDAGTDLFHLGLLMGAFALLKGQGGRGPGSSLPPPPGYY